MKMFSRFSAVFILPVIPNSSPWQETSYRNCLLNFMDELGFDELYRVLHRENNAFTFESKPLKLKSAIDLFLIAQSALKLNIKAAEMNYSIDHKAIALLSECGKVTTHFIAVRVRGNSTEPTCYI